MKKEDIENQIKDLREEIRKSDPFSRLILLSEMKILLEIQRKQEDEDAIAFSGTGEEALARVDKIIEESEKKRMGKHKETCFCQCHDLVSNDTDEKVCSHFDLLNRLES